MRLAAALGTALKRGARVVASRESPAACRMIKRAMISGPQLDRRRRRRPARAPGRGQPPPAEDARATTPASTSASATSIRRWSRSASSSSPGIQLTAALQKEIEKHFTRLELRRAAFNDGRHGHATRRACARATRRTCSPSLDVEAIRAARLPDRRRLRLLGRLVRAAAPARAARRRGGLARTASPRTAASRRRACARRSARRSGSCRRSAPTSASSSTAPASGSS